MKNRLLLAIFCTVYFITFQLKAEDISVISNNFMGEKNFNAPLLWNSSIKVGAITKHNTKDNASALFLATSLARVYGDASNQEVIFFQERQFQEASNKNEFAPNFWIIINDNLVEQGIPNKKRIISTLRTINVNFKELINQRDLGKHWVNGCGSLLVWSLSDKPKNIRFILYINEALTVSQKLSCVRQHIPRGFGVATTVQSYSIHNISNEIDVYTIGLLLARFVNSCNTEEINNFYCVGEKARNFYQKWSHIFFTQLKEDLD